LRTRLRASYDSPSLDYWTSFRWGLTKTHKRTSSILNDKTPNAKVLEACLPEAPMTTELCIKPLDAGTIP